MTREQRRQLERENAKRPAVLTEVPLAQWPNGGQQPPASQLLTRIRSRITMRHGH